MDKPRIPIDASALTTLHCARRYQLTCVQGYDTSSGASAWGSAFHVFLEHVGKFGNPSSTDLAPILSGIATKFNLLDEFPSLYLAASQWCAGHTIPVPITYVDSDGTRKPAVEFKFAFDLMETEEYIISLCGTMDLITLTQSGVVMVEDYKTSNYCRELDSIEAAYVHSFQLPLYMFALRKLKHLFPAHAYDISNGVIGRYRMIYKNFTPLKVRYSGIVLEWPEEKVLGILTPLIAKAISIWRLPPHTEAPQEGRALGVCHKTYCPFPTHCAADQTTAASLLAGIPRRDYNPLNFR